MAKSYKKNQGISLIEILIALALFSVLFSSLVGVQWNISELSIDAKRRILLHNQANTDFLKYLNNPSLPSSALHLMGVFRTITKLPLTKCESVILTLSEWKTGAYSSSTFSAMLLNPELNEAIKVGGDCGGQPRRFTIEDFHEISQLDMGYPISSIDILDSQIVIGLKPIFDNDPDIAVVLMNDTNSTRSLNIGTGINKVDAMTGLTLATQNSSSQQLLYFTFSDQGLDLSATSTLPQVVGLRPEGVSLFSYDSKVYVGTKRTAGHEFHVYDLFDSVLSWEGSIEVNHNINDIEIHNNFAFLATSGNIRDLIVLDISNSSHITQAAVVDLPGNEDGKTVYVSGDFIFLGRYKSVTVEHRELNIFQQKLLGSTISLHQVATASTNGDVNDLIFANGFVYAATSNPQREIQIFKFDYIQNDLNPVASIDLPSQAVAVDFKDNKIVFAAGNKLYIYEQD